jgi:hypothetical protein
MTSKSTPRQRPAGEEQGGADSEKVAELAERLELLELEVEGLLYHKMLTRRRTAADVLRTV